jgi:CheY-like chemotaxis protein
MPVMDGVSATRFIREEMGLKSLPIVICSAGVSPEDESMSWTAGANDFISKPINQDKLLHKLQSLLLTPTPEPMSNR